MKSNSYNLNYYLSLNCGNKLLELSTAKFGTKSEQVIVKTCINYLYLQFDLFDTKTSRSCSHRLRQIFNPVFSRASLKLFGDHNLLH